MTFWENRFLSSDGKHMITYFVYLPDGAASAVVQICHGMAEYTERYLDLISCFCAQGIAVCGLDYIGHGKSIGNGTKGCLANGKALDVLVNDHAILNSIVRKTFCHLPYILFGHSMGSFVARKYIVAYPDTVDGAVFSGTSGPDVPAGLGAFLARVIGWFKKKSSPAPFIGKIAFAGYNKRFDGNSAFSWLSSDEGVVKKYEEDPLCGFPFTAGSYRQMFECIKEVNKKEWFDAVPLSLPILIVSGSDDPVSTYGSGAKTVYDRLCDRELCDVQIKIYEGCRHELHNERNKEEVYSDLLGFVLKITDGVRACRMQQTCFGGSFGADIGN